jgi:hypothetical protein
MYGVVFFANIGRVKLTQDISAVQPMSSLDHLFLYFKENNKIAKKTLFVSFYIILSINFSRSYILSFLPFFSDCSTKTMAHHLQRVFQDKASQKLPVFVAFITAGVWD